MPTKNFPYEQVYVVVLNLVPSLRLQGSLVPRPCAALRRASVWPRRQTCQPQNVVPTSSLGRSNQKPCSPCSTHPAVEAVPGPGEAVHFLSSCFLGNLRLPTSEDPLLRPMASHRPCCLSLFLAHPLRHRPQPKPLFWGGASTLFEFLQILQRGGWGGRSPSESRVSTLFEFCRYSSGRVGGGGGGGGHSPPSICRYLARMPGFRDVLLLEILSGVPLEKPKRRGARQANYSGGVQFPDSKSSFESRICVPLSAPAHAGKHAA